MSASLTNLSDTSIQTSDISDCPLTVNQYGNILIDISKIKGNSIASNNGNLSASVPRVCIADNDTNISAMKTAIDTLNTNISAMNTNLENLYTIVNDCYISASHRIRTLAQAL